ncbi:MAG: hypothetical protein HC857_08790 [Synechococcales cyanobacterium RU_4_20]|nr:hypothetical protein [Synechococcales cyanobacterium RU_4_20]
MKLIAAIAALAAIALGLDNLRLRNQLTVATQASEAIARNSTPNPLIPSLASILQRPKSRLVALQNADASLSGTLLFTPGQWQEVVVAFGNLPPCLRIRSIACGWRWPMVRCCPAASFSRMRRDKSF